MLKVKSFLLGDISTNCYVLYSDSTKNAVVIDIAEKGGEEITNWLTQNGINPIAIMLTHGHFDHCGGVKQFN
ncbi:MAG: MBL fold metallo-hydrolase, partial [Clostridia bacterium]